MKTNEILQMTASDFSVVMHQAFLEWAMLRVNDNPKKAQQLILDKKIVNWFSVEFSKRCIEFKKVFKPYLNSDKIPLKTIIKLFWDVIESVFYIYPAVLMKHH